MGAARFRKRPVVIEAIRYTGDNAQQITDWAKANGVRVVERNPPNGGLAVDTLEGVMAAARGYWIVRGVAGEFYPCVPEVFAATYEPVTELPHEVRWSIQGHGTVVCRIGCSAPVGTPCRMVCPRLCESWPCGHGLVDGGACNAAEWFAAEGAMEFYEGDAHEPVSGPVRVWWDPAVESWRWAYPKEDPDG